MQLATEMFKVNWLTRCTFYRSCCGIFAGFLESRCRWGCLRYFAIPNSLLTEITFTSSLEDNRSWGLPTRRFDQSRVVLPPLPVDEGWPLTWPTYWLGQYYGRAVACWHL